jgi:outer membrane protein OmpA-like peptidoglycan-associated protein
MRSLLLAIVLITAPVMAQEGLDLRAESDATTVLVRGYLDPEASQPAVQATWRFATDTPATFSFQRLSIATGDRILTVRQLLLAALEQYLDQRVHFTKQGVRTDLPEERMLQEMNAMVERTSAEFGVGDAFAGFSATAFEQLDRVIQIDWSQASFGVDAGNDQDKYLAIYYYVRTQRQELERQLRADLMPLAAVEVLAAQPGDDVFAKGRSVTVPTVCTTVYDEENFLCALDLTVSDTLGGQSDVPLTDALLVNLARQARSKEGAEVLAAPGTSVRIRKRDRWLKAELDAINERIDQLDQRKELWALRDRMDDLEGRLDDIGYEVQELKEQAAAPSDNPIANLSDLVGRNVTLRFERGRSQLENGHRVLLNEVFEQLARSPSDRVLITGYTDRSGDAGVNLVLSEIRAKAVRDYLLRRGIPGDRLLVNYFGDSRSSGEDAGERRVEVEWLR